MHFSVFLKKRRYHVRKKKMFLGIALGREAENKLREIIQEFA